MNKRTIKDERGDDEGEQDIEVGDIIRFTWDEYLGESMGRYGVISPNKKGSGYLLVNLRSGTVIDRGFESIQEFNDTMVKSVELIKRDDAKLVIR